MSEDARAALDLIAGGARVSTRMLARTAGWSLIRAARALVELVDDGCVLQVAGTYELRPGRRSGEPRKDTRHAYREAVARR